MNFINYQDSRPIYEQIVERYKMLILKEVLSPDEQMPSVRKLAMELSTNPNTVQRAYMELERQGFLYSVRGRGSFVSSSCALLKEAREVGIEPEGLLQEAGWPFPK